LEWALHQFEHGGPYTIVEVEPRPATVGYPRFRFAIEFGPARTMMTSLGVYCLERGEYTLLASTPGVDLPTKL
jgi:hypothetical protein